MNYSKEHYEYLITSSPLFSLDRNREYSAFKRESLKMVEYLYCYLLAVNHEKYEPFGCEIYEVAARCIRNYDTGRGSFLHYFSAAWKKEFAHISKKEITDSKFRGVKISEEDKRYIRKFVALTKKKGLCSSGEKLYSLLAESMEIPIDKVKYIASAVDFTVTGDACTSSEGESYSIWDTIAEKVHVEDNIESREAVSELLHSIDAMYSSLQKRQKPVISDLITARLCYFLSADTASYTFISDEILANYHRLGAAPTQRELAAKHNRDEASLSRAFKEFSTKLKAEIERKGFLL